MSNLHNVNLQLYNLQKLKKNNRPLLVYRLRILLFYFLHIFQLKYECMFENENKDGQ